jgi:hypothetical protein
MEGYVVRMGEMRHAKFLSENLKERVHFGKLGVDWRIILKCISKI